MRSAVLAVLVVVGLASRAAADEPKLVDTLDASVAESQRFFATLVAVRSPETVVALPVRVDGGGASSTHRVLEQPVALDTATARQLSTTLLDTKSYRGGMTACLFDPAVAFRFSRGSEVVQVLVCFTCSDLVFEDSQGRLLSRKMSIGNGRAALLNAA